MDLFYESIHHPDSFNVNLENIGVRRAVELIEYHKLSPEQMHLLKVDTQRKVVRQMERDGGREEGKKQKALEIAKKLKEKGVDTDIICETSGLSKEEIETL